MKVNEYAKQFFLYSKNWYIRTGDFWADLNILYVVHRETLGERQNHLILIKLLECAFECLIEDCYHNGVFDRTRCVRSFKDFVFDLIPENRWRYIACYVIGVYKLDFMEVVARKCLSVMSMATIENLDPEKDVIATLSISKKRDKK